MTAKLNFKLNLAPPGPVTAVTVSAHGPGPARLSHESSVPVPGARWPQPPGSPGARRLLPQMMGHYFISSHAYRTSNACSNGGRVHPNVCHSLQRRSMQQRVRDALRRDDGRGRGTAGAVTS